MDFTTMNFFVFRFLPLSHPHFYSKCCQGRFHAYWVGRLWTQGTVATHYKMRLHIVRLENFLGKGNGIFLAEFFARADINIYFAVFRPCMQTDMALSNDNKARKAGI